MLTLPLQSYLAEASTTMFHFSGLLLVFLAGVGPCISAAPAQDVAAKTPTVDEPHEAASTIVTFSTPEDHRNMQMQLGITKLRPGPSGNSNDPNAANTDESKANPYPARAKAEPASTDATLEKPSRT